MTWVGAGVAGASIIGGLFSASASKSAAQQQAQAQEQAAQLQYKEFQTITGQEMPWMQAGQGAQSQLDYLLGIGTPGTAAQAGAYGVPARPGTASSSPAGGYGSLNKPFTADYMKQYSPAYQFQLQQGQQGVLNQDAGAQGAESGAALKDLMGFNQNYANTAFNNAFNQYNTQNTNTFNRLFSVSQLGQNAASNTGQQGASLAQSMAGNVANVGTALGAGTIGAANAYAGAAGNAGLLAGLYGQQAGGFGSPATSPQAAGTLPD